MQRAPKINPKWMEAPLVAAFVERLSNPSNLVPQLSRYAVASVLALTIDFATYLALCAIAVAPPQAGVAGYATGMVVSYVLSCRFVFDTAPSVKSEARRIGEFLLSGLAGLTVTGVVIEILTQSVAAGPVFSKAVAAIVSFAAVFAIRRSFVFAA